MITLETIIFLTVAGLLLGAAFMVALTKDTIHRALWLVLCFVTTACLWISLQAEFLGLVLILVYVGAVLTLFLFIIMTLPKQTSIPLNTPPFTQTVFLFALTLAGLVAILYALQDQFMRFPQQTTHLSNTLRHENTRKLGLELYTQYSYPFELAGILLLVAIIVSISLHHDTSKKSHLQNEKRMAQQDQINTKREDRITLVSGE